MARVPLVVIGEPDIEKMEGTDAATDETVALEVLQVEHPNEPVAPPTWAPIVPENVIGPLTPSEEVATPYTPDVPLETRRLLENGCDVVARPSHDIAPPPVRTVWAAHKRGALQVSDDVAMSANVFTPVE
jgi:hypothetical protein